MKNQLITKILAIAGIMGLVLIPAITPMVAQAATQTNFDSGFHLAPDCDPTKAPSETGACNVNAFVELIQKIINYLFYISIPIAGAFILYGAFAIITSGGNPAGFEKGKTIIYSAIIGIVIVASSGLIVTLIKEAITTVTK